MSDDNPAKDRAAVTGVGRTAISKNSGVSTTSLAFEVCTKAINDAGLTPKDIDGVLSYALFSDSVSVREIQTGLGMTNSQWNCDVNGGGSQSCAVLAQAAMAITSGLCKHIVAYRALNGRSGVRMGRIGTSGAARGFPGGSQWTAPFGFAGPPQQYAMMASRHMHVHGTTRDHLGHVAVTLRNNAVKNERAIMREPITLEDYHNSRMVADPFHILDCCQETDAGVAMVISRADLAKDLPHKPVYIRSFAYGGGKAIGGQMDKYEDFTALFPKHIAPGLYRRAEMTPDDIDIAEIYDAFTFVLLAQVEGFGFCKEGEGGPFIAEGNIAPTGKVPMATQGGLLSEGYVHGFNNVAEAVDQLRGDCGERQIRGASTALCSGFGGNMGSAVVLRN